jgi:hypothetical protein
VGYKLDGNFSELIHDETWTYKLELSLGHYSRELPLTTVWCVRHRA